MKTEPRMRGVISILASEAYLEGMKTRTTTATKASLTTSEAYLEGMKTCLAGTKQIGCPAVRSLPRRNENLSFLSFL